VAGLTKISRSSKLIITIITITTTTTITITMMMKSIIKPSKLNQPVKIKVIPGVRMITMAMTTMENT
jgi:hypothetical protein